MSDIDEKAKKMQKRVFRQIEFLKTDSIKAMMLGAEIAMIRLRLRPRARRSKIIMRRSK